MDALEPRCPCDRSMGTFLSSEVYSIPQSHVQIRRMNTLDDRTPHCLNCLKCESGYTHFFAVATTISISLLSVHRSWK